MNSELPEQIINELFPYFEALETQSAAILELLKDKELITDEQFAFYLERAGNRSNVKWLAARIRIGHLLSSIGREKEKDSNTHKDNGGANVEAQKDKESDPENKTAGAARGKDHEKNAEKDKSTANSLEITIGKVGSASDEKDSGRSAEKTNQDSRTPKKAGAASEENESAANHTEKNAK